MCLFIFLLCDFFDYKKINEIKCLQTKCTEQECLVWDDSLGRCGTRDALDKLKEYKLKSTTNKFYYDNNLNPEKKLVLHNVLEDFVRRHFESYKDSLEKKDSIYNFSLKHIENLNDFIRYGGKISQTNVILNDYREYRFSKYRDAKVNLCTLFIGYNCWLLWR